MELGGHFRLGDSRFGRCHCRRIHECRDIQRVFNFIHFSLGLHRALTDHRVNQVVGDHGCNLVRGLVHQLRELEGAIPTVRRKKVHPNPIPSGIRQSRRQLLPSASGIASHQFGQLVETRVRTEPDQIIRARFSPVENGSTVSSDHESQIGPIHAAVIEEARVLSKGIDIVDVVSGSVVVAQNQNVPFRDRLPQNPPSLGVGFGVHHCPPWCIRLLSIIRARLSSFPRFRAHLRLRAWNPDSARWVVPWVFKKPILVFLILAATLGTEASAPAPTSGETTVTTNRLAGEKSPYLLQHAYNPVDWYPWGEEAFEKAAKEDKPIFLSIGYSTCHWCHVMEHESFEDPIVAALMNEAFVNIKVDREERPDIDQVYMTVCQMLTGSGGWPLTIIMTPDKRPFFAATYIPKQSRYGRVGMVELVPRVQQFWQSDRDKLLESADQIVGRLETIQPEPAGNGSVRVWSGQPTNNSPNAMTPLVAALATGRNSRRRTTCSFFCSTGLGPETPPPSR